MQTARRVLVILLALAAACIVATMTVVVASTFANPVIIGYRQVPGPDIYLTLQEWIYLTRLLFPATSAVTAIPMMLVIVISEVRQLRSFRFYALSSAAVGAVWQVVLLLLLALFWPGLADMSFRAEIPRLGRSARHRDNGERRGRNCLLDDSGPERRVLALHSRRVPGRRKPVMP